MNRRLASALALVALLAALPAAAEMATSGFITVDLDEIGVPDHNGVYHLDRSTNLAVNPGFETGSLPPWTSNGWTVITADAHSGEHCAEGITNIWVRQDFDATDVGLINSITLWSKQPEGVAFHAIDLYYGGDDFDEFLVGPGVDWTLLDVTSELRNSGELTGIRVWSYSGGGGDPDITRIDDVDIDAEITTPTGASNWSVVKSMYN